MHVRVPRFRCTVAVLENRRGGQGGRARRRRDEGGRRLSIAAARVDGGRGRAGAGGRFSVRPLAPLCSRPQRGVVTNGWFTGLVNQQTSMQIFLSPRGLFSEISTVLWLVLFFFKKNRRSLLS